jgi:hypothetical protein
MAAAMAENPLRAVLPWLAVKILLSAKTEPMKRSGVIPLSLRVANKSLVDITFSIFADHRGASQITVQSTARDINCPKF